MADLSQPHDLHPTTAEDHLSRLFVEGVEEPWFLSLFRNIKDLVDPPKLPPLVLTSKPIAVKDIWGLYGRQKKSFAMSTGFQITVVVLLLTVASSRAVQDKVKQTFTLISPIDLAPPDMTPKKQTMQGGGGGGDRSPLPASKGRLPKASLRQFTPPVAVYNNLNPKLAMEPSIIAPPDVTLPQVNMSAYGDPLAKIGPPSNGPGSGGGIGSGSGGGLGPGSGGGFGDGVYKVGKGTTAPVLLYKKEPEYSEEARKAKFQGTVMLAVEVDASGRAINLRVVRSLGLGLDEKAMEAVRQWKFKPGYHDGKPVTVAATIEVNFRLL